MQGDTLSVVYITADTITCLEGRRKAGRRGESREGEYTKGSIERN